MPPLSLITSEFPAECPTAFPVAEQQACIVSNKPVNDEYRHLTVAIPLADKTGSAGQFFHLLCPGLGGAPPYLRRPMSIYASDAERGTVEFLYKVTGAGTRGLAQLRPGDTLNIVGPLGVGFHLLPELRSIVVAGRGVGLATLAPLAALAQQREIAVTAILSARRADLVMSADVFAEQGADVVVVHDDDGTSSMESVETIVRKLAANNRADALFTCGSRRLTAMLQTLGRELKIPGQVALEEQMACGLGMCFCCVRPFRRAEKTEHLRVCVQGPVFDLAEVLL